MQVVKLYTTLVCPYCVAAKRLLDSLKIDYEEINLSNDNKLRMKLSQENGGWRTVPMIVIGDDFIGGFQELNSLHQAGKLMPKVNG